MGVDEHGMRSSGVYPSLDPLWTLVLTACIVQLAIHLGLLAARDSDRSWMNVVSLLIVVLRLLLRLTSGGPKALS